MCYELPQIAETYVIAICPLNVRLVPIDSRKVKLSFTWIYLQADVAKAGEPHAHAGIVFRTIDCQFVGRPQCTPSTKFSPHLFDALGERVPDYDRSILRGLKMN